MDSVCFFLQGPKRQCWWYQVLYIHTKYIDSSNSKYSIYNIHIQLCYIHLYLTVYCWPELSNHPFPPVPRIVSPSQAVVSTSLKLSSSPCRSLQRSWAFNNATSCQVGLLFFKDSYPQEVNATLFVVVKQDRIDSMCFIISRTCSTAFDFQIQFYTFLERIHWTILQSANQSTNWNKYTAPSYRLPPAYTTFGELTMNPKGMDPARAHEQCFKWRTPCWSQL